MTRANLMRRPLLLGTRQSYHLDFDWESTNMVFRGLEDPIGCHSPATQQEGIKPTQFLLPLSS